MAVKRRIFEILEVAHVGDLASRWFDVFIIGLIALNVLTLILGTVPSLHGAYQVFRIFEIISVIVFTIEYALRLWTCKENPDVTLKRFPRLRFAGRGMLIIDLMAILPFYIALLVPAARALDLRVLRAIRLTRIFRLFKLGRYSESLKIMGKVFRAKREELGITVFVLVILLIIASSLMYFIENPGQPDAFSSIPASLWWGVATLTTVGYGDIVPLTALGKALGMIIAVLGIGLFALPAGILGSGFVEAFGSSKGEQLVCPHCGKGIRMS